MLFLNHMNEKNICYVKMPKYVVPYLQSKYGHPMIIAPLSVYETIMAGNLFRNKMLSARSANMSYSSYALKMMGQYKELSPREKPSVPAPDIKQQLIAVFLPDKTITRSNGVMEMKETDQYYQMSVLGARAFRAAAMKEFWFTLHNWIQEGKEEITKEIPKISLRVTKKDLIQKFMDYYDIDPEHLDTIYRDYHRVKGCYKRKINHKES